MGHLSNTCELEEVFALKFLVTIVARLEAMIRVRSLALSRSSLKWNMVNLEKQPQLLDSRNAFHNRDEDIVDDLELLVPVLEAKLEVCLRWTKEVTQASHSLLVEVNQLILDLFSGHGPRFPKELFHQIFIFKVLSQSPINIRERVCE